MATTISISNETKEKLRNLGKAGESYDEVINRMYEAARKQIMISYLNDMDDAIPIQEAIDSAKKKWQK